MARQEDIDRISQALSDPRRLQILDLLAAEHHAGRSSPERPDAPGALCAADLRPVLGGIAPSKLAYHLKQLRESGLVEEQQRGKWVYYTLNRSALTGYARWVAERWGERAQAAPVRSPPAPARVAPAARRRGSPPARAAVAYRPQSLILEED